MQLLLVKKLKLIKANYVSMAVAIFVYSYDIKKVLVPCLK